MIGSERARRGGTPSHLHGEDESYPDEDLRSPALRAAPTADVLTRSQLQSADRTSLCPPVSSGRTRIENRRRGGRAHLVEAHVIRDHGRYPSPREHVGPPARHNHRHHACASQRLFTNRRAGTYMEDSLNRPSPTPRRGTAAEHRRGRRTSRWCSATSLALRRASRRRPSSTRRRPTSRASRSRPRR
jgi:hypothetical protein